MKRASTIFFTVILWKFSAQGIDVVHRIDDPPVEGDILKIDEETVTVKAPKKSRTGLGYEVVKIPMQQVKFIDFEEIAGEKATIQRGNLKELRILWDEKAHRLAQPNSNAGDVGLALAARHLEEEGAISANASHLLYSRIEKEDWSIDRREAARRGRLQALIALGRQDEAIKEAKLLAEEAEEPRLILDAKHVVVAADFERLEKLIGDNPKWREDDTVHDEILALYQGIVDRSLQPFLFFGTNEEAAPRGLLFAARAHHLAGDETRARQVVEDIRALYPKSPYLSEGVELFSKPETNDDEQE